MADKFFRFGPTPLLVLVPNATNNVLKGPVQAAAGTGVPAQDIYMVLRHIRFVNKTAGAITFACYIGATGAAAAGTEVIGTNLSVAANSSYDWYGMLRMDAADYLVMGASAATSMVVEGEGTMAVI
jgi:hypothetical protein